MPISPPNKTNIIATIGPACGKASVLKRLMREGVDIVRINASHIETKQLPGYVRLIRQCARAVRKPVSVLVDLQGPRIRTGPLKHPKIVRLSRGQKIAIHMHRKIGDAAYLTTDDPRLNSAVHKGTRIFIDNGLIELEVLSISKNAIRCRVVTSGYLGENKGIIIPDAKRHLPSLTTNDRRHLKVALREGVDLIALSFVRDKKDIESLRKLIGKKSKSISIIAKIEKKEALRHIDEIIQAADGIMIARGDLGIEIGVHRVPFVQKMLVRKAHQIGVPVITATQMLESMMVNAQPLRAEVSDIANSVLEGSDAVMLSGETAVGKYPVQVVRIMRRITTEAENYLRSISSALNPK